MLNHLPKVLIKRSGIPAAVTDVAAEMQKLCPEMLPCRPARATAFLSQVVSVVLVSGDPLA
jgi:hypothetical protein